MDKNTRDWKTALVFLKSLIIQKEIQLPYQSVVSGKRIESKHGHKFCEYKDIYFDRKFGEITVKRKDKYQIIIEGNNFKYTFPPDMLFYIVGKMNRCSTPVQSKSLPYYSLFDGA